MIIFKAMKVELKVSAMSKVVTMGGCSKAWENTCGILYRV